MTAISIITPTYCREALLKAQLEQVLRQTFGDFEWLILDDSPLPSSFFRKFHDPRVRYTHCIGTRLSIGAKRNWLIDHAAGNVIAHFDDDDYYAPRYVEEMMRRIMQGADFAKLSGWFLYSTVYRKLAYWDTTVTKGLHFRFSREELKAAMFGEIEERTFSANYLGYGFSYVYRKAVWQKAPFLPLDHDEDVGLLTAALANGFKLSHFADTNGLCLHLLRGDNASLCWPQYVLPDFMLNQLFGDSNNVLTLL